MMRTGDLEMTRGEGGGATQQTHDDFFCFFCFFFVYFFFFFPRISRVFFHRLGKSASANLNGSWGSSPSWLPSTVLRRDEPRREPPLWLASPEAFWLFEL
jgi:hypothetical protein